MCHLVIDLIINLVQQKVYRKQQENDRSADGLLAAAICCYPTSIIFLQTIP